LLTGAGRFWRGWPGHERDDPAGLLVVGRAGEGEPGMSGGGRRRLGRVVTGPGADGFGPGSVPFNRMVD